MNALAVITGATSGIGAAFAEALAASGHDLLVTGRRRDILGERASRIAGRYGVGVFVRIVDFAHERETIELAEEVSRLGEIAYLVNNAGYGAAEPFRRQTGDQLTDMIRVHDHAPVRLVNAVLPGMLENRSGFIINVSSLAGYLPAPGSPVYTASKAFLTAYTEALAMNLEGTGIRVQALCPGFTRTDFHARIAGSETRIWERRGVRWMSSEDTVRVSLRSLDHGPVLCIPGIRNRLLYLGSRFIPRRSYYRIARRVGGTDR